MSTIGDRQAELLNQAWILLRKPHDLDTLVSKLQGVGFPDPVPLPEGFPCLVKYLIEDGQVLLIYLTEQEAIEFLRGAKTADRLQGDAPSRQGQDGWNKQMTAVVMAVLHTLIEAKVCTREQFEIANARMSALVDQEVAEYCSLGEDPRTAGFLQRVFGLDRE